MTGAHGAGVDADQRTDKQQLAELADPAEQGPAQDSRRQPDNRDQQSELQPRSQGEQRVDHARV
jgi:hypothetical protein